VPAACTEDRRDAQPRDPRGTLSCRLLRALPFLFTAAWLSAARCCGRSALPTGGPRSSRSQRDATASSRATAASRSVARTPAMSTPLVVAVAGVAVALTTLAAVMVDEMRGPVSAQSVQRLQQLNGLEGQGD